MEMTSLPAETEACCHDDRGRSTVAMTPKSTQRTFSIIFVLTLIYLVTPTQMEPACFCLQEIASSLRNPVALLDEPGGTNRMLIVEQRGMVWMLEPGGTGQNLLPFMDMRDRVMTSQALADERGLLGMALHPNFNTNGKVYVYYNKKMTDVSDQFTYVSEFKAVNQKVDMSSERYLLSIPQPHSRGNGGQLLFGKDGFLYVFVGHGGLEGDPQGNAQNPQTFLGKVLRIDVDQPILSDTVPSAYSIPADNPFVGSSTWKPEIFASGVHNMWRCSQDQKPDKHGNFRIFCGDTGAASFEEIDIIEKGKNYGWNLKEGLQCYNKNNCGTIVNEGVPIFVYNHSNSGGNAVVGGHVYRGQKFSTLEGAYVFGDVMTRKVTALHERNNNENQDHGSWVAEEWQPCPQHACPCDARHKLGSFLLAFGQDSAGELYILTTSTLNVDQPGGAAFKMVQPERNQDLTCGTANLQPMTSLLIMAVSLVLPVLNSLWYFH